MYIATRKSYCTVIDIIYATAWQPGESQAACRQINLHGFFVAYYGKQMQIKENSSIYQALLFSHLNIGWMICCHLNYVAT